MPLKAAEKDVITLPMALWVKILSYIQGDAKYLIEKKITQALRDELALSNTHKARVWQERFLRIPFWNSIFYNPFEKNTINFEDYLANKNIPALLRLSIIRYQLYTHRRLSVQSIHFINFCLNTPPFSINAITIMARLLHENHLGLDFMEPWLTTLNHSLSFNDDPQRLLAITDSLYHLFPYLDSKWHAILYARVYHLTHNRHKDVVKSGAAALTQAIIYASPHEPDMLCKRAKAIESLFSINAHDILASAITRGICFTLAKTDVQHLLQLFPILNLWSESQNIYLRQVAAQGLCRITMNSNPNYSVTLDRLQYLCQDINLDVQETVARGICNAIRNLSSTEILLLVPILCILCKDWKPDIRKFGEAGLNHAIERIHGKDILEFYKTLESWCHNHNRYLLYGAAKALIQIISRLDNQQLRDLFLTFKLLSHDPCPLVREVAMLGPSLVITHMHEQTTLNTLPDIIQLCKDTNLDTKIAGAKALNSALIRLDIEIIFHQLSLIKLLCIDKDHNIKNLGGEGVSIIAKRVTTKYVLTLLKIFKGWYKSKNNRIKQAGKLCLEKTVKGCTPTKASYLIQLLQNWCKSRNHKTKHFGTQGLRLVIECLDKERALKAVSISTLSIIDSRDHTTTNPPLSNISLEEIRNLLPNLKIACANPSRSVRKQSTKKLNEIMPYLASCDILDLWSTLEQLCIDSDQAVEQSGFEVIYVALTQIDPSKIPNGFYATIKRWYASGGDKRAHMDRIIEQLSLHYLLDLLADISDFELNHRLDIFDKISSQWSTDSFRNELLEKTKPPICFMDTSKNPVINANNKVEELTTETQGMTTESVNLSPANPR